MHLILFIGIALLSFLVQWNLKNKFEKYGKVFLPNRMTGRDVAVKMLHDNGIYDVRVISTPGQLTDHYNPVDKTVNLSEDVYNDCSVAAAAVAAHECGHAIQDKNGYFFLRLRRGMVPFVNLASKLGYVAIIIGLIFGAMGFFKIGILLEIVILVFQLITLPVEFDASSRALKKIEEYGIVTKEELKYCKKMLRSAALTYVAGVTASLLQVLRLVLMFRRND